MKDFISMHARGSGRTTRMIEEALRNDAEGEAVCILCHDNNFKREAERLAMLICKQKGVVLPSSIKFETVESLGFSNINWERKKLYHAHSNHKLIVDHHVYAKYFGFAIEGFHQYDNQMIVNKRDDRGFHDCDSYIPMRSK